MKQFLLFTLLIGCLPYCKAQPLEVIKATEDNSLSVQRTMSPSRYVRDVYIMNETYVVYQDYDLRKVFYPDMATFKVIDEDFSADKNGIYYQGKLVKVDTTGFKIIGSKEIKEIKGWSRGVDRYYWRTNKQAFFGTKPIAISDPATFETVTYCYFKDKNHVYYYDQIIEGINPNKINEKFTEDDRICDDKFLYRKGKPLYYKGEPVQQISSLIFKTSKYVLGYKWEDDETKSIFTELHSEDFDIPTLKTLTNYYLIDKNSLYNIPSYYPVRDEGFRVPIATEDLPNVKAFKSFATDGKLVYYGREPLEMYDAATFAEFPEVDYYQYDKNGVYNWSQKLPFRYTTPPVYGKNLFYIDGVVLYENQLYHHYPKTLIDNLTDKQIQELKDKKISYNQLLTNNNDAIQEDYDKPNPYPSKTVYQEVSYPYYKDAKKVYYFDRWAEDGKPLKEVKGYDAATLKEERNGFLVDKNYVYFGRYRLIKNRNFEVLAIYTGYRMGCSRDTHPQSDFYLLKNVDGYWLTELGGGAKLRFLGTELGDFEL